MKLTLESLGMTPAITRILRSRWFAACVHAALWLLLYLAVFRLGGKSFIRGEVDSSGNAPHDPVPVAALGRLFAPDIWPKTLGDTNTLNPFFTRYFIPPQAAPPTTLTIQVTYQGFYQAGDGPKHAIYRLGDAFIDAAIGAKVANGLFIADATMQALTLTNATAQTNMVPLNVKKDIVVPIQ
jgi:hypothetical protein